MTLTRALAALAVSLALATPAAAAITFDVDGVFGAPGGTLTGTFTTNDDATAVTAVHLMSSYNGAFVGSTYTDVADIDADWMPQYFRLTVLLHNGETEQLQLWFGTALTTTPGSSFQFSGFEAQQVPGSGNRMLSGEVTVEAPTAAAVPEPQTWALLLAGFGLAGASLRRRRAEACRAAPIACRAVSPA